MTENEALDRGRVVIQERGWRFREPARVVTYRRGLAGRSVHVVLTTSDARGASARVEIDARTGAVLSADYGSR